MAPRTSSSGSSSATSRIGRGPDAHAPVIGGNSRHNRCFWFVSPIKTLQSIASDRPPFAQTNHRKLSVPNASSRSGAFLAVREPAVRHTGRSHVVTGARAVSHDHDGVGEEGGRQWT
jgi:hypothetical protein